MIIINDTQQRKILIRIFFSVCLLLIVSSCSTNRKISYELTDITTKLYGDLLYENRSSKKYLRFNLDNNTTTVLSITKDDLGINHYTFFLNDFGVRRIFELEQEETTKVVLYECVYPSGLKLKKIYEIEKKGNEYLSGYMSVNELFYHYLFQHDKGFLVNLKTNDSRMISNGKIPFMFYANKYVIADQGKIYLSDLSDMSRNELLFEGSNPLFCQALNSIMYTSANESLNTVKIYKLFDNSIIDTGIVPLSGDRFDKDRYKYYFLNEPYMIYGVEDESPIKKLKASVLNIVSGGMITDRPCRYIIYNYKTHKDVGFIKNASVLDIKTYF